MVDVPPAVREKARVVGSEAWLSELDDLVAMLAEQWDCEIGRSFSDATEAYVAEVRCGDGTSAVLKVGVPRAFGTTDREATVLRLAAGDGCVSLRREAPEHRALLLERLGPSLHDLELPVGERHEILCATAARLWRAVSPCGLPTGADHARGLIELIEEKWEALDRPCTEHAVAHAITCAQRRADAHDDERSVLVRGDVHQWNALQAEAGFKLVDPDGLVAEPALDLGIVMREDPVELLEESDPRDRARRVARWTDLDAGAIWEWGVAERVATGLVCTEVGLQPWGRWMLLAADEVAGLEV